MGIAQHGNLSGQNSMKVVFVGASRFGLRCLKLAQQINSVEVVGIVAAPPVFPISYRPEGVTNVLHVDFAGYAEENGIPLVMFKERMSDPVLLEAIREWQPDIFLVIGWYHMIPKSWRAIAPAYGLHASLLPEYSGGAPLVWAIINGEKKTGITLFQMDDGVDTGPIAAQIAEPINNDDTIATLYARIETRGIELLNKTLPIMADGSLKLTEQSKTLRKIMPQRSPEDGHIDWSQEVNVIDRFIRAQTRPYPGAFSFFDDKKIVIWKATPLDFEQLKRVPPGVIVDIGHKFIDVACGAGVLRLNEFEIVGLKEVVESHIHQIGQVFT